jgi:ATP-binding cassette subfamily B protein
LSSALTAGSLLEAVIPVGSTVAIGVLISRLKNMGASDPAYFRSLIFWLGLAIGLSALDLIMVEVQKFFRKRLADEMSIDLQKRLYSHSARMDLAFFEESESLNRLFRASSGGSSGALGPIQSMMTGTAGLLQILSFFGLMFYLEPLPTIVIFLAALPMIVTQGINAMEKYQVDIQTTRRRRLSRYFTSRLAGRDAVPSTKLLDLAPLMIKRFEETSRSIIEEKRQLLRENAIRVIISVCLYMAVFLGVIAWLGYRFTIGTVSVGALATYCLSGFRVRGSFSRLVNATASGVESAFSIIPLMEFLETEPLIPDSGGLTLPVFRGEIELDHVSFTYPNTEEKVLDDISLKIPPGQTVAIVGQNGAGKSTLIKLLARLYETKGGSIRIDGHDIRKISLRFLHDHIAMVQQRPIRFEAIVHDNIAFGDWKRLMDDRDRVEEVAQKMGLDEFIQKLPQGYDTHLGRLFGEITLSAGQWQQLAIARALIREESILILDEPTSNLDTESERSIFNAIGELAKERTVILISHRFSTVRAADRILVLEAGKLVEDGSHDELMELGGLYACLNRYHHEVLTRDERFP